MQLALSLLILPFIALSQTVARAENIVFKLRNFAEKPLSGRIDVRIPRKESKELAWSTILNITGGEGRLANWKCVPPGIMFTAASFDFTYYLDAAEKVKTCSDGEIIFRFRRKDYASILEDALKTSPVLSSQNSIELHEEVLDALKRGSFSEAATKSMLLRDLIASEQGASAAEPYRVLSLDVAGSAVTDSQPLIFDKKQGKLVLAPETVRAVTAFQKARGLSTDGVVTWATAKSLPTRMDFKSAYKLRHLR